VIAGSEGQRAYRLLVILNRGAVNGAVRQMSHWLPAVGTGSFETMVAFLREQGPLGRSILPPGAHVCSGVMKSRWDAMGAARFILRARRWEPDVVFSIDERNSTVIARAAGWLTRGRVVHAIHSTSRRTHAAWWDRLTRRWVFRFIALSQAHQAQLERMGVPRNRIDIVSNGVCDQDPVERPRPPGTPVVVVFTGVLRRDKRVDLLLTALATIGERAPLLRLVIAGDGPERMALESYARSLGIGSRVSWLGWVEDPTAVLRQSDVFVLPSDPGVETLSMGALEAMAVGLPVVATAVGSMSDAVTADVGFLVPPGDVQGLAEALLLLHGDDDLRARLGRAGWRRQRDLFSASRLPSEMLRVLADAAGHERGARRAARDRPGV